jgi:hypothetical protein
LYRQTLFPDGELSQRSNPALRSCGSRLVASSLSFLATAMENVKLL